MVKKQAVQEVTDKFEEQNDAATALTVPNNTAQGMEIGQGLTTITGDGAASSEAAKAPAEHATDNTAIGLPEDVKKNLSGYASMELEELLMKCLSAYPHPINTDRIIITLWINHKHKEERTKVIRMLRALTAAGSVAKLDGTRGLYALTDQGKKLIGV